MKKFRSSWEVVDLQQTNQTVEQLLESAAQRSFDYEHGPLVHATLLVISPERRLLSITTRNSLADRRTLSNFALGVDCRRRRTRESSVSGGSDQNCRRGR